MKRLFAVTAFALLATLAASAQSNPVVTTVRHMLMGDQHNIVASARYMPASDYSFKASHTRGQWSFGHLMWHIGTSNFYMCSKIAGAAMPHRFHLTPHSPKHELIAQIVASFHYCDGVLAHVTDAELGEPIHLFGPHEVPKAAGVIGLATDLSNHYAMAAGFLRLKGILPPTARHGMMMGPMKMHHPMKH